jgi:thioredoxin reductase (NADPH)
MMQRTDVAVVGAGPIGVELAVALRRAGIDYLHFDARQVGQTISWFAPQTRFFSSNERIAIAGIPLQTPDQGKATREQYLAYLRGIVMEFDLAIRTYEPVVDIRRRDGGFVLTTRPQTGQRECWAKRIVLATGGTDRPRRLNVPGEDLPHVSHYFHDPHTYFRKRLLIVGGKNSAVEAALRCHQAGAHVSLSYRRSALPEKSIKYWLMPEIRSLIDSGKMPAYFNTVVSQITPGQVRLEVCGEGSGFVADEGSGFRVQDSGNGGRVGSASADANPSSSERHMDSNAPAFSSSPNPEPRTLNPLSLDADFVLLLVGYEQDPTLLRLAGIELDGVCNVPTYDAATMETNVPGIYVAGTAIGGTQERYTVFIENCHVHVERILAALTGSATPAAPEPIALPES